MIEWNKELQEYIWKTIAKVEYKEYIDQNWQDERITIDFTDWTYLELRSWDFESYKSWIAINRKD